MDTILPTWWRPHSFWLLADPELPLERPVRAFTFGLALTELRGLNDSQGVARFGKRFGYGWLVTLAEHLPGRAPDAEPSSLAHYLTNHIGIAEPKGYTSVDGVAGAGGAAVPSELVEEFAAGGGSAIRAWSLNAFSGLEVALTGFAARRERVPTGYEGAAWQFLEQTADGRPARLLENVNDLRGRSRWAYAYPNPLERLALEFEDLAVRRPTLRLCRLCRRVFVPLERGQSFCMGNVWSVDGRRLLSRCVPIRDVATYTEAAASEYRKRYKAAWARMHRDVDEWGRDSPRGKKATAAFARWKLENPSPAPPGRRRAPPESPRPPFTPAAG